MIARQGELTGSVVVSVNDKSGKRKIALDVAGIGVWSFMVDSGEVTWDEQMFRIFGYRPDSAPELKEAWAKAVHESDRQPVSQAFKACIETGEDFHAQFSITLPDGASRCVLVDARMDPGGGSRTKRVVGLCRDISARASSREVLDKTVRMLQQAERIAHMGSWELDFPTSKLTWSDEIFRLFEIDPEVFGASYEAFLGAIHPEDRDLVDRAFKDSLADREPYQAEHRLLMPDGRVKHVLERGNTQFDEHGAPIRTIGTVQDITRQKQLEMELRETNRNLEIASKEALAANEAKSRFLATMSHEIRTPIQVITGHLQLLEASCESDISQSHVRPALQASVMLKNLLDDLLDFSRIEAGKLDIESEPFDLRQCIGDVLALFRESAKRQGLDFSAEVDDSVPAWVRGDMIRLRQVLINLVGNAVKFTPQGLVRLVVAPESERPGEAGAASRLTFTVSDTGIGMTAAQVKRSLDSFSQVQSSRTRQFGGSGLGLAICTRLLELMESGLHVDSAPGEGSRFWFTLELPVAEAAVTVEQQAAYGGLLPGSDILRGSTILLTEDSPSLQTLTGQLLEQRGAQVIIAGNGQEALDAFARHPDLDLVIMDLHMPVMDGLEATRRLRAVRGPDDLPIIGLTADADPDVIEAARSSGMNRYLLKPVDFNLLLQAITRALDGELADDLAYPPAPGDGDLSVSEHDGGAIQVELALARMDGQADIYRESARRFLQHLPKLHADIRAYLAGGALNEAAALFHQLKGSSAMLGAQAMSQLAHRANRGLRSGQGDAVDIDQLLEAFDDLAASTAQRLERVIDELARGVDRDDG